PLRRQVAGGGGGRGRRPPPRRLAPAGEAPPPAPITSHEAVEARTAAASQAIVKNQTALQSLGLPLGWADRQNWPQGQGWPLYWDWLSKVMGLLVTAGAASLGAPFWFDVLSKVVSVRSAGEKPKSTG